MWRFSRHTSLFFLKIIYHISQVTTFLKLEWSACLMACDYSSPFGEDCHPFGGILFPLLGETGPTLGCDYPPLRGRLSPPFGGRVLPSQNLAWSSQNSASLVQNWGLPSAQFLACQPHFKYLSISIILKPEINFEWMNEPTELILAELSLLSHNKTLAILCIY